MATYDLSHSLEPGMQTYPDDPAVTLTPHADVDADGYRVTALSMGSHTGTHVDAPSHTEREGNTLGEFDIGTFRFDAQVADVRVGSRTAIEPSDLPEPTDADLLILHTGWDEHWGTDQYLDHPYLTQAAAAWCVDNEYHVATDALNVDPTPSPNAGAEEPSDFGAHHTILGAGHLIYENLTGLDRLPGRCEVHAYPLALDADGAPVRAVAITQD